MELAELRAELEAKLNKRPEMKRKITAISKLQWIETSYAFDTADNRKGSSPNAEEIQEIIRGEYLQGRTVQDHIMINNYYDMVKLAYAALAYKSKADVYLAQEINAVLTRPDIDSEKQVKYRESRAFIKEFSFVPPYADEVRKELEAFFRDYNRVYDRLEPLMRGCIIHNEFIRIQPFSQANEATARALLNFELVSGGFLPAVFSMDIKEYKIGVGRHINNTDIKPFYEIMLKAEKQRYESFLEKLR